MDSINSVAFDPFSPALAEEKDELRALQTALRRAHGFALLLVRCNDPNQRRDIIAALRADQPKAFFQEVHFRAPVRHLLDELQPLLPAQHPAAVFVSGLEASLPDAATAASSPLVANLNAARNSFPRVVPCPLVLFVPEYALVAMMQGAPDFYSVRSGLYFFARDLKKSNDVAVALLAEEWRELSNSSVEEKKKRIQEIQNLISDVRALPVSHQRSMIECSLLIRIGNIFQTLDEWCAAEQAHLDSLYIARKLEDWQMESHALNNLGIAYRVQGKWEQAEKCFLDDLRLSQESDRSKTYNNLGTLYLVQGRWNEAEKAFLSSLSIAKSSRDLMGEEKTLANLGALYLETGDLYKAGETLYESLRIKILVDDRATLPQTLNNLGLVLSLQNQYQKAEEVWGDGLEHCRILGDRLTEAQILNNQAVCYQKQSRWSEAEKAIERGLILKRSLGDAGGEAVSLANLAMLKINQGQLEAALKLLQQSIEISQDTQDERRTEMIREFKEQILKEMETRFGIVAEVPAIGTSRTDKSN